ncbi:MAG TPA: WecB/TagA/CpsF family glycosyltransferase, partial [Deinococcales bacterium]|nr:WecB/TagA/CpsF family glycosyltransferase [Deinococcales bacterium]
MPPAVSVLGHDVDSITLSEAADWLLARCAAGGPPGLLVTLNPEIIVQARTDAALDGALKAAALTVADGIGVVWAARRAGHVLPGRVPGVDLVGHALERGGSGLRVFFLGAKPGVAERAAAAAHARWGTDIAGSRHGYFDRRADAAEVSAEIAASGAQLLLAGLGEGQELFLHEHLAETGVAVAVGVGGTLDVLAGEAERTPGWTR